MNKVKLRPRVQAVLIGLLATLSLSFGGAYAQSKDAGNATDVVNPHSPRHGHPYRHGVVPTREAHENMKAWAAANRPVHPSAAAGKQHGASGAAR